MSNSNLWGGLTHAQLRHKWFGGQGAMIEEKIGIKQMMEIIAIIERRRGHYNAEMGVDLAAGPDRTIQVNPRSHTYIDPV
jgi:hypothetical protein